VAVVPVVSSSTKGGWTARPSTTHIVRSTDGGQTWNGVAQLPYSTAIPWVHDGSLYLFACKAGTAYRNDDLFLLRSQDRGASWTDPVTLFQGHFWNCHCGMIQREDRIYCGLCEFYGSKGTTPRSPRSESLADVQSTRVPRHSPPARSVVRRELARAKRD